MPTFPDVRIGPPVLYESLTVFPLFAEQGEPIDYQLTDEALAGGAITVEEVSDGGSVPDLLVENRGDTRVLFLEGEELIGAKQNRVLNTSLLIAASSKVKIPVSCVERGRWSYKSRQFGSSGSHCSSKLRHALKASVSSSLASGGGHRSDQSRVWQQVDEQQEALGVDSDTAAMSDSFIALGEQITDYSQKLEYPEGATGMAVAVRGKVVALDLFDKPATCQKVWRRLMSGFILDALEAPSSAASVEPAAVESLLQVLKSSRWEQVPPVGEGEEYRATPGDGLQGSALTFGGAMVHGSVVAITA